MNDTPLTHDDVVLRIKLLADQLQENGFNFYLLVGKDSLCSCIARSNEKDLEAMIQSMQAKQTYFQQRMQSLGITDEDNRSMQAKQTYFQQRMQSLGITDEDNRITVKINSNEIVDTPTGREQKEFDLGKFFSRLRYQNQPIDKSGKPIKYKIPK